RDHPPAVEDAPFGAWGLSVHDGLLPFSTPVNILYSCRLSSTGKTDLMVFQRGHPMSKQSRQFKVPDALANTYDFANTLDVRHFIEHGAPHRQDDELKAREDLAGWMEQRRLARPGTRVTPAVFGAAL